jgi:hypothetical protein
MAPYLEESGLRQPDRAQVDLPDFQVRPDFVYDAHQALVFIDGPYRKRGRTTKSPTT